MVVRERQQDLVPLQAQPGPEPFEDQVAHRPGDALEVAGDQYAPPTVGVFQRQCFHPEIVELAVRGTTPAIAGQPD